MTTWQSLDAELARWRSAGRPTTFWLRDDDASKDSASLHRLLELADVAMLPVALAVIPATLEPSLVAAVARSRLASVIQHGYAHRNHASPLERKMELGAHRDVEVTIAELARGAVVLKRDFGDRFVAILVPPWNRIADPVIARLSDAGFLGLSTLGPRQTRMDERGLLHCNTHVDLIAWRRNRTFIGSAAAIDRVLAHLRARRTKNVDADEPTGVLTHHLDMHEAGWQFVVDLVARTREAGAVWIDARTAFAAPVAASTISGRST